MMQKRICLRIITICFIIVLQIPAAGSAAASADVPQNPNSAKACAICHYRWIGTFFVEGRGTDLVPYQSEKVAADAEMCFSCHDGSVMDSRKRMRHGNEHKTDVKPPADMKIPAAFPLDENGKVQCATCHTAHGVPSGPGMDETIFMRVSNRNSAMCRMCHPDKAGGPDAGNHSLGAGEQIIPKTLKVRGAHEGNKKNQMICETCHTAHGAPREGYLVMGAGDSELCITCHRDKNIFDPSGVRNANHVINVRPQKATVPEALREKGAKLGYTDVITCQTCHKVHNNKINQPALLVEKNEKSRFCMTCHTDKQRLEKTRHNLEISAKDEKNLQGKTVSESGVCSACHLPHNPARRLPEKYEDTDRTTALCMSCHARGKVAENEKLAGYSHPVGMTLTEMIRDADADPYRTIVLENERLDLPLFNKLGVADKNGEMTCATCHDTHGGPEVQKTEVRKLEIRETLLPETGTATPKYTLLRKPSPGLCRACHDDKFAIRGSGHDLESEFPDGHEIMTQKIDKPGLCRNCHFLHNSEPDGFIWGRKISTETGTKIYDMCAPCHQEGGLAAHKIITENSHPVNVSLSEGMRTRLKGLPLFNAAGEVADNGVITCYTCHDPHRRTPVLSKSGEPVAVEGRPLERFLRLDTAPESDICLRCHPDKTDVRQSDHNLLRTAPGARNIAGRTSFESGICGTCHLVHHNAEGIRLWARQLGNGDHVMDRICNSCHSEKGAAAAKVPEISSHPETLFVANFQNSPMAAPLFPIFDQENARLVMAGRISCPSCHDAHQWCSDGFRQGDETNREGNVASSFLRPHLPERVCSRCHGPEGLFMFKYFHKADKRKEPKQGIGRNRFVIP